MRQCKRVLPAWIPALQRLACAPTLQTECSELARGFDNHQWVITNNFQFKMTDTLEGETLVGGRGHPSSLSWPLQFCSPITRLGKE